MAGHWIAGVGALLLLASTFAAWPGYGYDGVRLPLVALGAALVAAGGAVIARRGAPERRPSKAWWIAAGLYALAHLVSVANATHVGAAVDALVPLAGGLAMGVAVARAWMPPRLREALPAVLSALGIVVAAPAIAWRAQGQEAIAFLGNTNYEGAFSAVTACVGLGTLLFTTHGAYRSIGIAAALLGAAHVAFSNSRGGMLGLTAGVLAIAGVLAARRRWRPAAACLALLALPVALNAPRAAAILRLDDGGRVRLGLWQGSLRLAGDHPAIGCGAGNFQAAFPPYRDAEEFAISHRHAPDVFVEARDPHSTWLNALATIGPAGLAALAALFVLAAIAVARNARTVDALGPAAGGLAALAVAGCFNTLAGYAPFDVVGGALLGLAAGAAAPEAARGSVVARAVAAAAALGLLVPAWLTTLANGRVSFAMREATTMSARIGGLASALSARPDHVEALMHIARSRLRSGDVKTAMRDFRRALERQPHDVNLLNSYAASLQRDGDVKGAVEVLRRAERLAPGWWMTHYNLGVLLDSRDELLKSVELNPRNGRGHFQLGLLALTARNRKEAVRHFQVARLEGVDVADEIRAVRPDLVNDPDFRDFFPSMPP